MLVAGTGSRELWEVMEQGKSRAMLLGDKGVRNLAMSC